MKKRDLKRCCRCFDSMILRFIYFFNFEIAFSEESNIINKEEGKKQIGVQIEYTELTLDSTHAV